MKNYFLKDYILFLALQIQLWTRYSFYNIFIWFSIVCLKESYFHNTLQMQLKEGEAGSALEVSSVQSEFETWTLIFQARNIFSV